MTVAITKAAADARFRTVDHAAINIGFLVLVGVVAATWNIRRPQSRGPAPHRPRIRAHSSTTHTEQRAKAHVHTA